MRLGLEQRAVYSLMAGGLAVFLAGGCSSANSTAKPPASPPPSSSSAAPAGAPTGAPAGTVDSSPATAASSPPASSAERVWPAWLGPERNSISRETGWLANWPANGPPIAWRTQIGIGFSAVSVVPGHLIAMGHRQGRDVVQCLDPLSGDKLWEHAYTCELVDSLHEGGPGATATIADGEVYTLSREGHLHCLELATGKVRWLREFKKELGAVQPDWGFTSSPYLVGSQVIVDVGYVVAVDRQSGQIAWKSDQYRAGYGTAVAFENAGRKLLAVFNNDGLLVLGQDGRKVAFYPLESQYATTSTTPIVVEDTIFVSVGYRGGSTLLRLKENVLEPVYSTKEMANHFNNCVLWNGHLYGFDGNSHVSSQVRLVCIDFATGQVKWHQRGFGCGSLMAADGKLIVLGDEGTLATVAADPTGYKEISRAKVLDGRCWTMPVLVNGRIYCRNAAGDLVCLDVNP